jgi:hypothetical protein
MMHARGQRASRLEEFLRSNPIALLVGVGVGVGTVVAGVMAYLTSQKLEDLDIQHKTIISTLEAKNSREIYEATKSLDAKIADLTFKLTSIERRLPGTGPSYFDVSTVSIGPQTLKTLNSRYTSYDNDGFFVAVPPSANWQFATTNEFDFLTSMYPFAATEISPQLQAFAAAASKTPVFFWKSNNQLEIFTNMGSNQLKLSFYPVILVEHVDQALLKERFQAIASGRDTSVTNVTSKVGQTLDVQTRAPSDSFPRSNILDEPAEKLLNQSSELLESELSNRRKQELLKTLDELVNNDLANYMFFELIAQTFMSNGMLAAHNFHTHNRITSAQKKGNVFYIQVKTVFEEVDLSINGAIKHHEKNISLDEEIFYFSRGLDGYVVKIYLPSLPERGDNFAWSMSWLTGLQIPVD